jgi:DNA-binding transcriptional ArsR family regulator
MSKELGQPEPPDAARGPAGMAATFQALGDPARLLVVQLLSQGPQRAGQLAEAARLSAPAMSKHLRVLLATGLVADERLPGDARLRVFRLRPQAIVAVQAWLDQIKAHWDEQLLSFKKHVEGER